MIKEVRLNTFLTLKKLSEALILLKGFMALYHRYINPKG